MAQGCQGFKMPCRIDHEASMWKTGCIVNSNGQIIDQIRFSVEGKTNELTKCFQAMHGTVNGRAGARSISCDWYGQQVRFIGGQLWVRFVQICDDER